MAESSSLPIKPRALRLTGRELGRGAYGIVFEGKLGDESVAVKVIHPVIAFDKPREAFEKECNILSDLHHKSIIRTHGAYKNEKGETILVMEKMKEDLRSFLERNRGQLSLKRQLEICLGIAEGFKFLHERPTPVAHRDANDKNILISEEGIIKVSDFGQSKLLSNAMEPMTSTAPGNAMFMPPEALQPGNIPYNLKIDIFSIGVLMLEVCTQAFPSCGLTDIGAVPEVQRRRKDLELLPDQHPLKQVIIRCLHNNPKSRPDIAHVYSIVQRHLLEAEMRSWSTLEDFGYFFDDDGSLKSLEDRGSFQFDLFPDQKTNKLRYELLGNVVREHVYNLLERETDLEKIFVPLAAVGDEPRTFFFRSKGASASGKKLLLLINGSGAVRAGQWSRRLIINNSIDSGSQLPYIKRAIQVGYDVIVLNPNDGSGVRGSATPVEHAAYVWNHFVVPSRAPSVDIVAHSYGAMVTINLSCQQQQSFREKVNKVALTGRNVNIGPLGPRREVSHLLSSANCIVQWRTSNHDQPVGEVLSNHYLQERSGGTTTSEEIPWRAMEDVFTFLTSDHESREYRPDSGSCSIQ